MPGPEPEGKDNSRSPSAKAPLAAAVATTSRGSADCEGNAPYYHDYLSEAPWVDPCSYAEVAPDSEDEDVVQPTSCSYAAGPCTNAAEVSSAVPIAMVLP